MNNYVINILIFLPQRQRQALAHWRSVVLEEVDLEVYHVEREDTAQRCEMFGGVTEWHHHPEALAANRRQGLPE